ncbi:hypothetical protein TNCT_165821 [Trichonephila clavata]|uniref:Uncharacterized protein n=1 Tax=Trichonephila clavata TaxID=2740835 RepID=A0A8X6HYS1_TRICU|nr:hypothetical protein TNCT_698181 [Trichonephila clavata]GFR32294.1 hypothetical protein TNCT_165821 [Trichonephila clavata]
MADLGINIALDPKTSYHLTRLAEVTKEPIQELAKRLIIEGIESLPEEIRLDIEEAIEKELKVNPNKAGKPLRGKLRGYRRLRFDNYRLIYRVNIPKRKVFLVTAGHRDNIYKRAGLLDLLPKL